MEDVLVTWDLGSKDLQNSVNLCFLTGYSFQWFLLFSTFFQAGEAGEESSDSDGEQEETSHKLIRKVSTSGQIRAKVGKDGAKEKYVCVEVGF